MTYSHSQPIFSTKLNVRFHSVNIGNHLDYAGLLEMAGHSRALFLAEHGLDDIHIDKLGLMMKSLQVDYLSEGFFNDVLRFDWYVENLRNASFLVCIHVFNESTGKIAAKIHKKFVFYDYAAKKLAKVPDIFKQLL